jgi:hypothetical protein
MPVDPDVDVVAVWEKYNSDRNDRAWTDSQEGAIMSG